MEQLRSQDQPWEEGTSLRQLLMVDLSGWEGSNVLLTAGHCGAEWSGTGRGSQAGCSGTWSVALLCEQTWTAKLVRAGLQSEVCLKSSQNWHPSCAPPFHAMAQPDLPMFRPTAVLTFPVVGDDWRFSCLCMGRGWAPVSSGLSGLNECALSIHPLTPSLHLHH